MAEEKKYIIIPDTNFIREHPYDFDNVLKVLKKHGEVFISEITIEEKIAQERIEIKRDYAKINEEKEKYKQIADISFKQSLDERIKWREDLTLSNYKKSFGNNVIKFEKNEKVFSMVLERAYNKIPPFSQSSSTDKNPSDKGFKDTLLWLSLINYFKINKSDKEIVFITNDNGFIKNCEALTQEFFDATKQKIQISNSEFYQNLIADKKNTEFDKNTIIKEVTDIELENLRKEINHAVEGICFIWDQEYGEMKEVFSVKFGGIIDTELTQYFENIQKIINKNIFNEYVSAKDFWGDIVDSVYYNVRIEKYIELNNIYLKMKNTYPNYLSQFFHTVASIFNKNATELPF